MLEVWKHVIDAHGYEVSNFGRVRSYRKLGSRTGELVKEPRILKMGKGNAHGYHVVNICRNGDGQKPVGIHILVLTAFVGPCPPGKEGLHIDGCKTNNLLDNLRWGTHKENMEDMVRHGTSKRGEKDPRCRRSVETVRIIKGLLAKGLPITEVSKITGVHYNAVHHIARGRAWAWLTI